MTTVCIIGAGELAGAAAAALASQQRVGRVLLVDERADAAAGKALDIQQAGAITGAHTALAGTGDLSRIIGCAVCVIADRFLPGSPEWEGDEALRLLGRLAPYAGDAPIVFAGARQAGLLLAAAREGRFGSRRLIGSSPEALVSAITAIVAMEAACSPAEVALNVLGTPPAGFVVPWGDGSVGGYPLDRVLTQVELGRIESRASRLWPPGPYALGHAAARVVATLLGSMRRVPSVLAMLDGEFGVRGCVGAVPAVLSPSGIVRTRVPALHTRERVRLETALGADPGAFPPA